MWFRYLSVTSRVSEQSITDTYTMCPAAIWGSVLLNAPGARDHRHVSLRIPQRLAFSSTLHPLYQPNVEPMFRKLPWGTATEHFLSL